MAAVALLVVLLAGTTSASGMPEPGERAPEWVLDDLQGNPVAFPQVGLGRTSVILFWAGWCHYCKALMPRLSALLDDPGAREISAFAIRIADDEPITGASTGLTILDHGDPVAWRYGVETVPALFIVDRSGRVVYRLDYPPAEHPSQQTGDRSHQAGLLAEWWESRLRGVLDLQRPRVQADPG
ncbi:MAG: TlpA disulfide reductase family protein [Xanthomonadales bacterium]|nr:TlpA disulfide reductase family protein [Xanthomonadales bacterium]